ncbi:hypothetical protein GGD67_002901 [Bradyrhizobium sp. IAR9]|nr:hypothetical protein [Bradyrhizobium sp. IAR9]NYG45443.1 hypothetical protein [Bradyrhizobium sp. IAR9]
MDPIFIIDEQRTRPEMGRMARVCSQRDAYLAFEAAPAELAI